MGEGTGKAVGTGASATLPAGSWKDRASRLLGNPLVVAAELVVALLAAVFVQTIVGLLIAWLSLWLRRTGWRGVGLTRPDNWGVAIAVGVVAGVSYQFLSLYLTSPLISRLTGEELDLSLFAGVEGNLGALLVLLAVIWTLAAFGEELFYRGYAMNRVTRFTGTGGVGWALSLILVSALFGVSHLYQGPTGVIESSLSGLVFGALYLASRRNLWVPVLAHGAYDTAGALILFFGLYP